MIGSQSSLERIELALTVNCGHLFDPPEIEGLAHLAEHVTLAADPADLNGFIDDRLGALNAFTAEELTTFHLEFDVDDDAEPLAELRDVCRRFAALFEAGALASTTEALVRQELPRIHSEWQALTHSPPRPVLELAALRLRAKPSHAWRRIGRGDVNSLPLANAAALAAAVDDLRASRYSLGSATISLTSPLPLDVAAQVLRSAFSTPSQPPPLRPPPLRPPPLDPSVSSLPLVEGGGGMNEIAVETNLPRGGRSLTLAWSIPFAHPVRASRSKPLALLGAALTSPHAGGLSSRLREAALSPALCVREPVVLTRTLARTSSWAIWQVELILVEGEEARWRDALALCRAAVASVAEGGLPTHVAAESATLASLAWRYGSRPPTALELSVDLQAEPTDAMAVTSGRSFVGAPAANAAAATAAARCCAASPPVVTLYAPSLSSIAAAIGVSPTPAASRPRGEAAPALPLRYAPLPAAPEVPPLIAPTSPPPVTLPPVTLPPVNPWVPADGPAVARPLMERLRLGACDDFRTGGGLPSCLHARAEDGLGVLQLPACISGSGVELGSKAALAAVGCASVPRPFAVVLLQLYTRRPQEAFNGDQRSTKAAALAELWRYALAEAVGTQGALAARAGAKWEVTFNPAGIRIAVTGHREQVGSLLAIVLRLALRRAPRQGAELREVEAGRNAALRVARNQLASSTDAAELVRAREANLQEATPAELAAELEAIWSSILAADLLLAGPVRREVAASLVGDTRAQLRPVLSGAARSVGREPDAQPEKTFARGLAAWEPLLYKPAWEPRPLAQNLCLEPAIAAILDQCGA